jgi:hypothetical protein
MSARRQHEKEHTMAAKKTEKIETGGKPQPARLRACDHCGEKAPANELQAKLVISYSDEGTKHSAMQRVIKGHA